MRIIAGRYGGRRLKVPPGVIRPAMDQMRESVFASLGDLSGVSFLDLFAGSGSVGIEAASRGAARVLFVESDRKKIATLKANVSILEEIDAQVVARPVERVLKAAARRDDGADAAREPFDYVFADPPFPYRSRESLLSALGVSPLLREGSLVMLHYPAEDPLPAETAGLERLRERRFGRSVVSFFRRSALS